MMSTSALGNGSVKKLPRVKLRVPKTFSSTALSSVFEHRYQAPAA
jgi:hypothetical protein